MRLLMLIFIVALLIPDSLSGIGTSSISGRSNNAPVTTAPQIIAVPGNDVNVPVTVTDFNNIGAVSLTLIYDPDVIIYQPSGNTSAFPGLIFNSPSPGTIIIAGLNMAPNGFSLPDGSTLFTLTFNYTSGFTGLNWHDDGTSCEYTGPVPDFIPLNDIPTSNYYINGFVGSQPPGLQGEIAYHHYTGSNLPMENVSVKLKNINGDILAETLTNSTGFYEFSSVPAGTTRVEVASPIPAGGINATDALAILQRSVGNPVSFWDPEGFMDNVADVDASGTVNATDALNVLLRTVQLISTFPAGNWAFYSDGINFTNSGGSKAWIAYSGQQQINILALCYGDVNRSFNLNTGKSFNQFTSQEVIYAVHGKTFTLPLTINSNRIISAASIHLKYNPELINISGFESEDSGLVYNITGSSIRIAWSNTLPLASDQIRLNLLAEIIGNITHEDEIFFLADDTEFADAALVVLEDVEIDIPRISLKTGENKSSGNPLNSFIYYPNPFIKALTISYSLIARSDVQILLTSSSGQSMILHEGWKEPGKYSFQYDAEQDALQYGIYYLTLTATNAISRCRRTEKVVFIKE